MKALHPDRLWLLPFLNITSVTSAKYFGNVDDGFDWRDALGRSARWPGSQADGRNVLYAGGCLCRSGCTAYEKLTLVPSPQFDRDGEPVGEHQVRLAPGGFVERFAGLTAEAVYRYQSAFEFRAGSYSGYNNWRNELAKLAGYAQTPYKSFDGKIELRYDATVWKSGKGPFWELIDFSDAEGVIGPLVCERVHQDFLRYRAAAAKHADEYFRSSYEEWTKAFAMCANGGAIEFH